MAPNKKGKKQKPIRDPDELLESINEAMQELDLEEKERFIVTLESLVKKFKTTDTTIRRTVEIDKENERMAMEMLREVPYYAGDYRHLRGFISQAERVFMMKCLNEERFLKMMGMKMKEEALSWYQYMGWKLETWKEFKTSLMTSFGSKCPEIDRVRLARRYQGKRENSKAFVWHMLDEYRWHFPEYSEEEIVNCIKLNLKPEIKTNMKYSGRLKTVQELIDVTNEAEMFLRSNAMYNSAMDRNDRQFQMNRNFRKVNREEHTLN